MPTYSILQIYDAARSAGFTPEQATTWTAIAMAESGGNVDAHNPSGEDSRGLWQINVGAGVRENTYGNLYDPVVNARAAYDISHHGTDMSPWTTTHTGTTGTAPYMTYLPRVEAVTGVQGDGRGVVGYGSPPNDPLPTASAPQPVPQPDPYDQIDQGHSPGAQRDSDHDGLTDAFERAAGTGIHTADSDHDGLSDAYEVGISHSDPTLADSDHDGLSDSTEAALGTSAMNWDSDHDGLSDRVELRYGSNPLTPDSGDGVAPPAVAPPVAPVAAAGTPAVTAAMTTANHPMTEGYQHVDLGSGDEYHRFDLGKDSSGRPLILNGRTIAMLDQADNHLGFNLSIIQGSYQTNGAAASAGTHDGGGAIDVRTSGLSSQQVDDAVAALRAQGFAAWHRTTDQFDEDHIHAVAIGDKDLASSAQDQVVSYLNGGDGLAGGADDGPKPISHEFDYAAAIHGDPLVGAAAFPGEPGAAGASALPGGHLDGNAGAGSTKLDEFLQAAVAQKGDSYVFGHEVDLADPNPAAFDCSELTQWAAAQAGVTIPDGAMYQYLDLKSSGHLMSVDEALHTPGALLFHFSSEPTAGGARPAEAHVAISLGNGKTIEAANPSDGVTEFSAAGRFEYAGVIPGLGDPAVPTAGFSAPASADDLTSSAGDPISLSYDAMYGGAPAETPADADHDGLSDAFEKLAGTNAHLRDTDHDGLDDAYEAIDTHTDPLAADTDHDHVSDASEIATGTDPGSLPGIAGVSGQGQFAENIRDGIKDADHDGLSDLFEHRTGLNPHSADSDSDGLSDSTEVALGTDPDAADTDHDGLADAFEVRFGMDPLHAPVPAAGMGDGLGALDPAADTVPGGTDPDDAITPGGPWP